MIGQFGSGSKNGVAVCLRNEVPPIVFCGTLRLEFFTKPQTVADGIASKEFSRVVVKFAGTDPATGASRSSTEDLGFVLDYGKHDWNEVALALREFVSNAIDRSIRESGDWSAVKVEIVQENQVRAKAGCTRVFVPMTNPDVLQFYNDLGKWFLHFSEPESLNKAILPKTNRNLTDRRAAVIYRRGVRVREFQAQETESLFDYNLNDLTIDEAVRRRIGTCVITVVGHWQMPTQKPWRFLFDQLLNTTKSYWEYGFDTYSLHGQRDDQRRNWQDAFTQVAGETAVLTVEETAERLERKGYKAVKAPENLGQCRRSPGCQDADAGSICRRPRWSLGRPANSFCASGSQCGLEDDRGFWADA